MRPREWRKQVQAVADEFGYTVTTTRNGHLRLVKPGRPPVITAGSSSDHRAIKNVRSWIRRNERTS